MHGNMLKSLQETLGYMRAATNEFYRIYEVKPCRQIDYGLYVANFKTAYDGMRLSMNLYAMDGVMVFIKDDKTTAEPTGNNTDQ